MISELLTDTSGLINKSHRANDPKTLPDLRLLLSLVIKPLVFAKVMSRASVALPPGLRRSKRRAVAARHLHRQPPPEPEPEINEDEESESEDESDSSEVFAQVRPEPGPSELELRRQLQESMRLRQVAEERERALRNELLARPGAPWSDERGELHARERRESFFL